MSETAITNRNPLLSAKACEEAETELKHNLPPWDFAKCSEKLVLCAYYIGICLPVLVLLSLAITGYSMYIAFFIVPLLTHESDPPDLYYYHSSLEQDQAKLKGWVCLGLMSWFALCFSISYYRAVSVPPGHIPLTSEWRIASEEENEDSNESNLLQPMERRIDGSLRTCNYCHLLKPDRTHHCKQCETCVLQMDHHCNWIANCVGFYNFKYFLLLVFYGALMLLLYVGTFWESVVVNLNDPGVPESVAFWVSFCYTFLCFLCLADVSFFVFHIWLIAFNYTTIEFCEKKRQNVPQYRVSPYDLGAWDNFKRMLGPNVLWWPFPFKYRQGGETGLYFN